MTPFILAPASLPRGEQHRDSLWVRRECFRYYVEQRRLHCDYLQILNLWLQAPYCEDCILSDPIRRDDRPDVSGDGWQVDMLLSLGQADRIVASAEESLREDPEFAFTCKKCLCELRPWDGDPVWVINYHLEDHYGIDLSTPGRLNPPRRIREQVFALYGNKCFRCGGIEGLHIDHIRPRAEGGDSAFRNLQPLCKACGNLKGTTLPSEIEVFNPLYFTAPPSDSWEHLFW